MTVFTYKAINENGNPVSGEVEADSEDTAFEIISSKGEIPESVVQKRGTARAGKTDFLGPLIQKLSPVKPREMILFTKQLRTLVNAGVPMIRILSVMEVQTENKRLKSIIPKISEDIREGSTLSDAFSSHRDVFSPLYCSMVQAGESSGALPDVLDRLIYIIEHEHKVKSDIKAALRYPAIVVCFLAVAFFVLLTFVIPKFISIFRSADIELPLPTRVCILLYNIVANYWHVMLGSLFLAIIAIVLALQTEKGRYIKDRLMMKLPLLGPLFLKAAMSRFASIFSILQSSGIIVLDSMDILTHTIGNTAIKKEFVRIKERLTEGRGISEPLSQAKYFTPMVINMVAVGEESGNLDDMLSEISIHYDTEVEYSTKALSEAIGPILTIGLACVVGFFALAIFLPMWDLTKVVR